MLALAASGGGKGKLTVDTGRHFLRGSIISVHSIPRIPTGL
jgi:hypothetical protein